MNIMMSTSSPFTSTISTAGTKFQHGHIYTQKSSTCICVHVVSMSTIHCPYIHITCLSIPCVVRSNTMLYQLYEKTDQLMLPYTILKNITYFQEYLLISTFYICICWMWHNDITTISGIMEVTICRWFWQYRLKFKMAWLHVTIVFPW